MVNKLASSLGENGPRPHLSNQWASFCMRVGPDDFNTGQKQIKYMTYTMPARIPVVMQRARFQPACSAATIGIFRYFFLFPTHSGQLISPEYMHMYVSVFLLKQFSKQKGRGRSP